ncbi:LysE family translocator [Litoribrevibacter albus]|uniref:Threonine transporter RhtB n=1 Tax=Litoribrevibacter albus TaxID=1473156 RepID=A0AA37SDT9_9GAMM|nr:LysE family translocator [Litoribrevibacter albus]GLQ32598.1 threonine transporter RhtB [Litoribrevibacter albus]
MLTLETITLFFTASVLLSISPGPDNIFVLMQSITQGPKAGMVTTLGLCTGLLVHSTAAVLGVAVIFQTSEIAFTVLKLVGAAYLLYLAWGAFRAKSSELSKSQTKTPLKKLYFRGIAMSTTNPKLSIFFLAFLPQFVDPALGSVSLQLTSLSAIFIVSALLVFNAIALMSGHLRNYLADSDKAQTVLNRVAGFVFVGLALKLATTR